MELYFIFGEEADVCVVRTSSNGNELYRGSYSENSLFDSEGKLILSNKRTSLFNWLLSLFSISFTLAANTKSTVTFLPRNLLLLSRKACFYKDDLFEIYFHFGYKISIFKNGNQVAYLDKFDKMNQTYKVVYNDLVDVKFLLGIVFDLTSKRGHDVVREIVFRANLNFLFGKKFNPNFLH